MSHQTPLGQETVFEVEFREWQLREIQKGLSGADRGDFATDAEVAEIVRRWSMRDECAVNSG